VVWLLWIEYDYKVSIKSGAISSSNIPSSKLQSLLHSPLCAPSYLLSDCILHVIGWCCVLMFSDDHSSSDADYRICKIPILLPLRITCVIALNMHRF
jgi:hypothetical protein